MNRLDHYKHSKKVIKSDVDHSNYYKLNIDYFGHYEYSEGLLDSMKIVDYYKYSRKSPNSIWITLTIMNIETNY